MHGYAIGHLRLMVTPLSSCNPPFHLPSYSCRTEGKGALVGLVHNWMWFEQRRGNFNPLVNWLCGRLTDIWSNQRVQHFLKV